MALLVYNALVAVALLPFLALMLVSVARGGRFARTWRGQLTLDMPRVPAGARVVWLHAASVGESLAVEALVAEMKRRHPDRLVVLTSTSWAGHELATKRGIGDRRAFLPLDVPGLPGRLLDRIRPELVVIAETEIWPNLIAACDVRGIPVVVVNGRLSPSRERSYRRLAWFYRRVLGPVRGFLMQSPLDAARLVALGVPQERVRVTGDLKVDRTFAAARGIDAAAVARDLALPAGPVLLAGSTHPGEDAAVRDAWARLANEIPDLVLVVAPRHLERVGVVTDGFRGAQLAYRLRSRELAEGRPSPSGELPRALLLDTMGELAAAYATATVAFVGGTLVPVGGHSVFEPAAFACPVIVGPHDFNFREEGEALVAAGAAVRVHDGEELYQAARRWLTDRAAGKAAGEAGRRVVAGMAGATQRTMDALELLR